MSDLQQAPPNPQETGWAGTHNALQQKEEGFGFKPQKRDLLNPPDPEITGVFVGFT